MKCPKCGAAINRQQVQQSQARCLWCNHSWTVDADELPAPVAPEPPAPVRGPAPPVPAYRPSRPRGVQVRETEVHIRPRQGVEVRHGPLPSPQDPRVVVGNARLARLDVRAEQTYTSVRGHRQTVTHYTLRAGSTVLMRKFSERSVVEYVAHLIAATVETPVEVRSSSM